MFTNHPKLKVTIANSSSYSRLVLSSMLQAQPDLEVLDIATDEVTLMASLRLNKPDVVLADQNLDFQKNSYFLRQLYLETGVPVLMLCEKESGADYFSSTYKSGIYDYILKPAHQIQPKLREVQTEILAKIRAINKPKYLPALGKTNGISYSLKSTVFNNTPKSIIAIGASTGGTQAIETLVRNLEANLDACLLIAVHLPAGFTSSFAKRLQTLTGFKVIEGATGRKVFKGKIIIAPGGKNMVIIPCLTQPGTFEIKITNSSINEYDKPSVDTLMLSVAKYAGKTALGIVLSGMGKDGTKGLEAIKKYQGFTLAQNQASSVIFGMAKSAIEKGHVDEVLALPEIPGFINKYVAELPAVPKTLHTSN